MMPRLETNESDARRRETLSDDISVHIFTVSDLLAADALFFLAACVCSYIALRKRATRRLQGLERFADAAFIIGLLLMVAVCGFITYAIV